MHDKRNILLKLNENLNILQEREAKYGGNAPLDLLNQIEDHQQAIDLTHQAITGELTEAEWHEALKPLLLAIDNGQEVNAEVTGDTTIHIGDVKGDILGNIAGRDVIITTVYEAPPSPLPLAETKRQHELGILLNKVRNSWIRSSLEKSLFNEIQIDLVLEERLDVIDFVREVPEHPRQQLPHGVKVINKFDEMGKGRTLLILGGAGSGKTTVLLEVARDLIERAENNEKLSVPVVFNLSSWSHEKWDFVKWLINEFDIFYNIPGKLSEPWIKNQQLLLLLDGLDEVKKGLRESCVQAINQFNKEFGQTEIIVCCRDKVYEYLAHHLRFQSILYIEPLNDDQIEAYLSHVGEELSGVTEALKIDPVLRELAKTPLMLNVMAISYEGMSISEISGMTFEEWQHYLWKRYIDRAFARKHVDTGYSSTRALHWLRFLARRMVEESQTLFLIEQIKPSWLEPGMERRVYPILVGLIAGLTIEWIYGLPLGFIAGILSYQMLAGLLCGIVLGIIGSLSPDIKLFTAMGWSWSWEKAWKAAIPGLLSGPFIGFLIWLFGKPFGLTTSSLQLYLILGLATGLLIALISVTFAGLVSNKLDSTTDTTFDALTNTNQGIWQSAHRALSTTAITFIVFILPMALFIDPFIPLSVILGCITLYAGGMTCLQHITIRTILWQGGRSPWDYAGFLSDSTNRVLIEKRGGSYQFRHDFLRQEIAYKYTRETRNEHFKPKFSKIKLGLIGLAATVFVLVSIIVPMTINTGKIDAFDAPIFTPRLEQGDRVVFDRVSHYFFPLTRGAIIFIIPSPEMEDSGFPYPRDFKQVLGLPGEEIEIIEGKVYIDGRPLDNSNFTAHPDFQNYGPNIVSPNMYLVTVNNPNYYDEKDKWTIYLISKDQVDSQVLFRFWPLRKFGLVPW